MSLSNVQLGQVIQLGLHNLSCNTADAVEVMAKEFYQGCSVGTVGESGHYIAEEQPERFVKRMLGFIEK